MTDLADLSLAEAARGAREGLFSAVELVRACLDRIEREDARLGAFLLVMRGVALAEAEARDRARAEGRALGPLHGVPVAIKDIIDVKGQPTTANSRIHVTERAAEDAPVVARLRAAGAVILGKTSLHEFATGGPSFDLPWPPARNPLDFARHPGGSSSGSGVAVAVGMAHGALGTDTGGSVRNPATVCGLVGMKPTYGAISRRGVFPLAFSLDQVGPITRDVRDNALLYDGCLGHDPRDPTSLRDASAAAGAFEGGVEGLRIGLIEEFNREATPEIQSGVRAAVAALRSLGAEITPLRLPPLANFADCGRLILQAESYAVHKRWLGERPKDYGSRARTKLLSGAMIDAGTYIQAQQLRRELTLAWRAAIATVDAALCVSSLEPACAIDDDSEIDRSYDRQARMPFNLVGAPALVVPCGWGGPGAPLAVQIVGPDRSEPMLYRIGSAIEGSGLHSGAPIGLDPGTEGAPVGREASR